MNCGHIPYLRKYYDPEREAITSRNVLLARFVQHHVVQIHVAIGRDGVAPEDHISFTVGEWSPHIFLNQAPLERTLLSDNNLLEEIREQGNYS